MIWLSAISITSWTPPSTLPVSLLIKLLKCGVLGNSFIAGVGRLLRLGLFSKNSSNGFLVLLRFVFTSSRVCMLFLPPNILLISLPKLSPRCSILGFGISNNSSIVLAPSVIKYFHCNWSGVSSSILLSALPFILMWAISSGLIPFVVFLIIPFKGFVPFKFLPTCISCCIDWINLSFWFLSSLKYTFLSTPRLSR